MRAMVEPYWQRLSVREQGLVLAASVLLACVGALAGRRAAFARLA